MRQIVLDTETTGLETAQGHRIIEIGCVEIVNRRISGRTYHQYLNPEREIEEGAFKVHGLSTDFLREKPRFSECVQEFLQFIQGAELLIHNAPFDVGFIEYELRLLKKDRKPLSAYCSKIVDTLKMARKKHLGQKNGLDALCKRYNVDNSQRDLHGALLDAQLLAEVYLLMTGGQTSLLLSGADSRAEEIEIRRVPADHPPLPVIEPDAAEQQAHRQRLAAIDKISGGQCLWLRLEPDNL
ncbi:MAG: DNA polymerase III subunit epsilon [Gammaproteobacteria bacterium]|nr:DNA polymerase III subunit epsilon [Gammaproteobacteria bacterium]